jgi:hypothetical protein
MSSQEDERVTFQHFQVWQLTACLDQLGPQQHGEGRAKYELDQLGIEAHCLMPPRFVDGGRGGKGPYGEDRATNATAPFNT